MTAWADSRFADPPRVGVDPGSGAVVYDHPLLSVAAALEEATDEYREALDSEAVAENAFKKSWAVTFLTEDKIAATMRHKFAEAKADDKRAEWAVATARVKRAKAKVDELQSRLMAFQSYYRLVERQT